MKARSGRCRLPPLRTSLVDGRLGENRDWIDDGHGEVAVLEHERDFRAPGNHDLRAAGDELFRRAAHLEWNRAALPVVIRRRWVF